MCEDQTTILGEKGNKQTMPFKCGLILENVFELCFHSVYYLLHYHNSILIVAGTHPAVGETTSATACASSFDGGCCSRSYNMKVKNCGDYYVYNLTHTDGCYQAYCFGKNSFVPRKYCRINISKSTGGILHKSRSSQVLAQVIELYEISKTGSHLYTLFLHILFDLSALKMHVLY